MSKAFDPNQESKSLGEAFLRLAYSIVKLILVLVLSIGTVGYLLPTALAVANERRDTLTIFIWNLLFGWTVIGWILVFLWARKSDQT